VNADDLDSPLDVTDCAVCGSEQWWPCLCDTDAVDVKAMFAPTPGEGDEDS